jgi:hypothetical protein
MASHPQVKSPREKEIGYFRDAFGWNDKCGEAANWTEYLEMFPTITTEEHAKSGALTGEWSVTYYAGYPCVAQTVHSRLPHAALVVLLRNPIDRAYSRFQEQAAFAAQDEETGDQYAARLAVGTTVTWPQYVRRKLPQLKACLAAAGDDQSAQVVCAARENILGWSLYGTLLQVR